MSNRSIQWSNELAQRERLAAMTPERIEMIRGLYNGNGPSLLVTELMNYSGAERARRLPQPYVADALALLHLGCM